MLLSTLLAAGKPLGGVFENISDKFSPSSSDPVGPINNIFTQIYGFLTVIAGVFFLIYFITGGLSWITAGGDTQKVDAAKKTMTNGAIGMIIIVAAYSIVSIVGSVLGFTILNPGQLILDNFQ